MEVTDLFFTYFNDQGGPTHYLLPAASSDAKENVIKGMSLSDCGRELMVQWKKGIDETENMHVNSN